MKCSAYWIYQIIQATVFMYCSLAPSIGKAAEVKLKEVLESMNRNYPVILQTQEDKTKSEADLLSAQGGFDPLLKASTMNVPVGYYTYNYFDVSVEQPTPWWGTRVYSGWRLGKGNFPYYDGKLATFTQGEVRVGLEVPLLRNGAIDERRTKLLTAENGIPLAQTSISLVQLETTRLATHRYWDWVAAGKKLTIAESLLEIAGTRDKALLHRYKKGDAPKFEHRENQRVVIQRQSLLLAAQRAFQKSVFELSLYYRDSSGNPILLKRDQVPTKFPEPEAETLPKEKAELHFLVSEHPEVKRLSYQMNQNQIDLKLSKNALLPKLDFQFGYSQDIGAPSIPENPSSYSLQPLANYPGELKVGASFEFPLLTRSASGQAQSLQAIYNKLEDQSILTRNRIETTISDSLQAMEVARKRSGLAQEELTIAKELEEGERTRFQHGDSQLFIVNLREQSTGEAAIREVDAMAEYHRARADYLASTAR